MRYIDILCPELDHKPPVGDGFLGILLGVAVVTLTLDPVFGYLQRTLVSLQQPLLAGADVGLVETEAVLVTGGQARVAVEEDGQRVVHRGLAGDDDGLVHRVRTYLVVVDLDSPTRLGSEDELAASPGVAGDQLGGPTVVLQRDGLEAIVDRDLHGQIVQLVVTVSHAEPGQQRGYHVSRGRVRLDHDGLVGQVGPQTRGIHADGVAGHV